MCILGITGHCATDEGKYVALAKGFETLLALN